MSEQLAPKEQEISIEQKQAFYEKVRSFAPYDNQPIDDFGSYETRYEREDGYISIYMPVMADHVSEDEFVDDAVRVLVRHEDELENGITILRTEHYIYHAVDNETEYGESFRAVNSETGQRVGPVPSIDMDEISMLYDLKNQVESNVFTAQRLLAVNQVLDSIEPAHRF